MPLKHLSNFWGTLEMPYCEINIILTWSVNCIIFEDDRATTFVIRDIKLYVTAVILSTQNNTKNYCNNWNQFSDAQLTGININQSYQQKDQINI